ncbi:MAG: acyl-CoA dehydrogenase family protein [Actinomycetota bacterium]
MTDERQMLVQTLDQVLSTHCGPQVVEDAEGGWSPDVWRVLEETGLIGVGVPDGVGGAGGELEDAIAMAQSLARHAAPVPWSETAMLAGWLSARTGLSWTDEPATVSPPDGTDVRYAGGVLGGTLARVPWASCASRVLVLARDDDGGHHLALVDPAACTVAPAVNVAGEPRDDVTLDGVTPQEVVDIDPAVVAKVRERGALVRTAQMVGAQGRVLDLTVEYATTREQFGRPIGSFQAVRQQVAILAGEAAVAAAGLHGAVDAVVAGDGALQVAMAKVRASQASTRMGAIAHQVHGALGFTQEHRLQHFTRRMWAWRDEFGSQGAWEVHLGERFVEQGAGALWPSLTT